MKMSPWQTLKSNVTYMWERETSLVQEEDGNDAGEDLLTEPGEEVDDEGELTHTSYDQQNH